MEPDDAGRRLIERMASKDWNALRVFVERYEPAIYRFVRRIAGDDDAAEEVVSDIFHEAWRRARRYDHNVRPSVWLFAIAHRLLESALAELGEDAWRARAELDEAAPGAIHSRPLEPGEGILAQAMRQLSAEHREIVDLVYVQGMSVADIAYILDLSDAGVKARMFHARARLAELPNSKGGG